MFIFVKSAATNANKRNLVRKTWGLIKYVNGGLFSTIFVLGRVNDTVQTLVDKEIKRCNDILQVDVIDTYTNVSGKSLATMQWASENLDGNAFFTSCDDDMSVNIGGIQEVIDEYILVTANKTWPEFPILCFYRWKHYIESPIRDERNKNYVSIKDYKWPAFPHFCYGGTYGTSVNVAGQLYEVSRTARIINTDDVWITGILRNRLGMPDQMLINIEPGLATHLGDKNKFDQFATEKIFTIMREEAFENIKSKSSCVC